MNKKAKKENIWTQTRPLQIAALVIAVAVGSVMLFNNGQANSGENRATAISEENSRVINVTDDIFQETIAEGVVLVDFWAVWCPPCRIQNPIIEEVAIAIGDEARIAKLDVDHNPQAAQINRVQNIPTLIIFKDGEPVQRFVGVQQKDALMAALRSHM